MTHLPSVDHRRGSRRVRQNESWVTDLVDAMSTGTQAQSEREEALLATVRFWSGSYS